MLASASLAWMKSSVLLVYAQFAGAGVAGWVAGAKCSSGSFGLCSYACGWLTPVKLI